MNEVLAGIYERLHGMSDWQALGFTVSSGLIILFLFLDTDWKRRLFETHAEKMKRCPKYRDKYLKRALRDTPKLIPGNKPRDGFK